MAMADKVANSKITQVTEDMTLKMAKLCNLELSPEETAKLSSLFGETLEYIKTLDELDTNNVAETFQVTGLTNVFQKPETSATLSQEDIQNHLKINSKNLFETSAVFER